MDAAAAAVVTARYGAGVLAAVLLVLGCADILDRAGNACSSADAIYDGEERWCPQDDAVVRCRYLALKVAQFEVLCGGVSADVEIVQAVVERDLACDTALVVYPEADACLEVLTQRSCSTVELPDLCQGVVLGP